MDITFLNKKRVFLKRYKNSALIPRRDETVTIEISLKDSIHSGRFRCTVIGVEMYMNQQFATIIVDNLRKMSC